MPSILIITLHYPPSLASGAFRLGGFARHLSELGWDISVVCPNEVPLEPVDRSSHKDSGSELIKVSYVPFPNNLWSRVRRRAYSKMRWFHKHSIWLRPALRECRRLLKQDTPDIVLTSGPPHFLHRMGRAIKQQTGIKWIADFRDPWVTGNWLTQKSTWYERIEERRCIATADIVVANAPNALRALVERFPEHVKKMVTITNGFDPDNFTHEFSQSGRELESRSAVRLVHAGELYAGRDPAPIIEGMRDAKKEGVRVELRLIGRADSSKPRLKQLLETHGMDDQVHFTGQLSYPDACAEIMSGSILLLLDSPGRKIGVPAKLYEYLGAKHPILALAEPGSDTEDVLKRSGVLYRLASPNDAQAIRASVLELSRLVTKRGPHLFDKDQSSQYTRRHTAEILSQHCLQLLERDK